MTTEEFYKKYGTTPRELDRLVKIYNEIWFEKNKSKFLYINLISP